MENLLPAEYLVRRAVADAINDVARQHKLNINADPAELIARPKFTVECTGNNKRISSAIFDFMFPRESFPTGLVHFTSLAALKSISKTNELRLYTISKRLGQGELDQFAEDHNFKGYTDDSDGPAYYRELSKDLFYISLTRENTNAQASLWSVFGNQNRGVQLHFNITITTAGDLRSINYQSPARQFLKQVNNLLRVGANGDAPFIPWTVSKIGAFYLPSTLTLEDEIRFLIKRYKCGIDDVKSDGTHEYWPVQLAQNTPYGRFDLTKITCGPDCDIEEVRNLIRGTRLEGTPVNPLN